MDLRGAAYIKSLGHVPLAKCFYIKQGEYVRTDDTGLYSPSVAHIALSATSCRLVSG